MPPAPRPPAQWPCHPRPRRHPARGRCALPGTRPWPLGCAACTVRSAPTGAPCHSSPPADSPTSSWPTSAPTPLCCSTAPTRWPPSMSRPGWSRLRTLRAPRRTPTQRETTSYTRRLPLPNPELVHSPTANLPAQTSLHHEHFRKTRALGGRQTRKITCNHSSPPISNPKAK